MKTTRRKEKKSKLDKQKAPLSTPMTEAKLELELTRCT